MKRTVILLITAAAFFSSSCQTRNVPGSWAPLDLNGPNAENALAFISSELAKKYPDVKIIKIIRAEVQIAAGKKYKFEIEYTSDTNIEARIMKVYLFRNLKKKYTLKDIKFD